MAENLIQLSGSDTLTKSLKNNPSTSTDCLGGEMGRRFNERGEPYKKCREPRLVLVAGNSNRTLSKEISQYLGIDLLRAEIGRFPDGEVKVRLKQGVRGATAFVIQSLCPPVNDNLVELGLVMDALWRSHAQAVIPVIPYFGYGRQERRDQSHTPISAKWVARVLGINSSRVILMDVHTGAIEGFFDVPVDHLLARPLMLLALEKSDNQVLAAADQGISKAAEKWARRLRMPLATVGKIRLGDRKVEVSYVLGKEFVTGKRVCLIDDMIATGGTTISGAEALRKNGAFSVDVAIIHPICAAEALKKLSEATFEGEPLIRRIFTTNGVPLADRLKAFPSLEERVEIISLAPLLGETIAQVFINGSVGQLFDKASYLRATSQPPEPEADPVASDEALDTVEG